MHTQSNYALPFQKPPKKPYLARHYDENVVKSTYDSKNKMFKVNVEGMGQVYQTGDDFETFYKKVNNIKEVKPQIIRNPFAYIDQVLEQPIIQKEKQPRKERMHFNYHTSKVSMVDPTDREPPKTTMDQGHQEIGKYTRQLMKEIKNKETPRFNN